MQDEIETSKLSAIAWAMHTRAEIAINGRTATLTQGKAHLRVRILEPEDAAFTIESAARAKPEDPNDGMQKLMIHLPDRSGSTRIVVLFTPYRNRPTDYTPSVRPLSEWTSKDEG